MLITHICSFTRFWGQDFYLNLSEETLQYLPLSTGRQQRAGSEPWPAVKKKGQTSRVCCSSVLILIGPDLIDWFS